MLLRIAGSKARHGITSAMHAAPWRRAEGTFPQSFLLERVQVGGGSSGGRRIVNPVQIGCHDLAVLPEEKLRERRARWTMASALQLLDMRR